jgi:putative membrane-bound dehydrogenase-like protein
MPNLPVYSRAALLCAALVSVRSEEPLPQVERLQSSPVLRHLKPNPHRAMEGVAAETVNQMHVPEGFSAEVVVAEPDLHQPIAFAFDERGRIWVAEAYSYPQRQPEGEGKDKLVIFEDTNGDGKFENRKVFAEGLNLVSGFEVGYGGVWVGAAPQLLFIADRNRDDVPDGPPEVLLDGFGYQDTHECLNSFMWGPDGWLYGNQGVFNFARIGKPGSPDKDRVELRAGVWRYHPARREFEVFAEGGSNQWGLDYDERGQIFMTHCRSYWGRGGTTHVIQGGHFWNQANANYPSFIVAEPPRDYPDFRGYLLASARYDHGAGGAGEPGSDAIYGGHSHVGTMIYYGDNWPDEYRGRIFTHNLHGHQINQQANRRWGSGYDTVHAGRDMFFCADPKYVGIDLQYGPDGAVYFIDWHDQQHCHNPNSERWDRSNGRLYRMQYTATYKPVQGDMSKLSDVELMKSQTHKNDWHGRTARRLLHERASTRAIDHEAVEIVREAFTGHPDRGLRLRALWIAHLIGLGEHALPLALNDADEDIRAWAVQMAAERRETGSEIGAKFVQMARADPSASVRLFLASAAQRLPNELAWRILETLADRAEDREDRNIPYLIWHGLGPRVAGNIGRSLELAAKTQLPQLAHWIWWHAAAIDEQALEQVVELLGRADEKEQKRLLAGIELGMKTRATARKPKAWKEVAPRLMASKDPAVVRRAELVAGALGDHSRFDLHRRTLASATAPDAERHHAFEVLSRAQDQASASVFIGLLRDPRFRERVLPVLARHQDERIAPAIIAEFGSFSPEERNMALNVLTGRASFALALLDAVASGKIRRDQLTAYNVRQLTQLKNPEVDRRVAENWGRISSSAGEKEAFIAKMEKVYNEAPLWAYDGRRAGREHFEKLCAQCHVLGSVGTRIGPELTVAGRNGIRYYLENIIDPNAVVGTDFQMTTVETKDGDVISGLLVNESPDALVIRSTVGEQKVSKPDVASRTLSDTSLMPEGLLEALSEREQIELLKFLMEN